jgi:gentisate 1,2-dioxygenase
MTEKYDPKTQALLFIEEMLFPEIQDEVYAISNAQTVPLGSFMDYYSHHEKVSSFLRTKNMPQFDGNALKQVLNTYETSQYRTIQSIHKRLTRGAKHTIRRSTNSTLRHLTSPKKSAA